MALQEIGTAAPLVPSRPTLRKLKIAAAGCQACDLWKTGTQTVFGEGSQDAEVMFVGEQPGDQEDKQGRPFVGPAGRVLDEALEAAGASWAVCSPLDIGHDDEAVDLIAEARA